MQRFLFVFRVDNRLKYGIISTWA